MNQASSCCQKLEAEFTPYKRKCLKQYLFHSQALVVRWHAGVNLFNNVKRSAKNLPGWPVCALLIDTHPRSKNKLTHIIICRIWTSKHAETHAPWLVLEIDKRGATKCPHFYHIHKKYYVPSLSVLQTNVPFCNRGVRTDKCFHLHDFFPHLSEKHTSLSTVYSCENI